MAKNFYQDGCHPTTRKPSLKYILDSRTLITRLVAQRPSFDKVLFDSL